MAKGKNAKVLALILALVLTVGGVIGGTVAWLIASDDPVVNTFTYGDINIELEETDTELDGDENPNTNEYEMLPGQEIIKDPFITVKADSENSWLFVKLDKSENFDEFMTYTIAWGWTQLVDEAGMPVEGVYFLYHGESGEDEEYEVLMDNAVYVKETVTKEMLNELDAGEVEDYPTLTVTAYAVQHLGFEVGEAYPDENTAALAAWNAILANQNP